MTAKLTRDIPVNTNVTKSNSINMTMGIPFNTKKTKSMSAQK